MKPQIATRPYNWSTDRHKQPIVAIIAHNTVGKDSRAYLSRGGDLPDGSDRKVSIHKLFTRSGVIYSYVPDERAANHAGYGTMPDPWSHINPNLCTLGFELENLSNGMGVVEAYPEPQLLTMGWQINDWRAKHGYLPIFRHADIDPHRRKDTAGLTVAQMEYWASRAAALFADNRPLWRVKPNVTSAVVRVLPTQLSAQVGSLHPSDSPFRGEVVSGSTVTLQGFGSSSDWVRMGAGYIWKLLLSQA